MSDKLLQEIALEAKTYLVKDAEQKRQCQNIWKLMRVVAALRRAGIPTLPTQNSAEGSVSSWELQSGSISLIGDENKEAGKTNSKFCSFICLAVRCHSLTF
ncbi:unnamed protein product [Effrenium voratum]|uniref:Uncharacterized protein n=1 Tax=Effrenium voratum TaxID=2562239 RepID=A0AA36JHZ5_9DINO|nr:unnamed protein product [Effrenium voratum]CAJ1405406.1 unnamed protein product [Effrenium voratum]